MTAGTKLKDCWSVQTSAWLTHQLTCGQLQPGTKPTQPAYLSKYCHLKNVHMHKLFFSIVSWQIYQLAIYSVILFSELFFLPRNRVSWQIYQEMMVSQVRLESIPNGKFSNRRRHLTKVHQKCLKNKAQTLKIKFLNSVKKSTAEVRSKLISYLTLLLSSTKGWPYLQFPTSHQGSYYSQNWTLTWGK